MSLFVTYEKKSMPNGEWVDVCGYNGLYIAVSRDCVSAWSTNNNTWHLQKIFPDNIKAVFPHITCSRGIFIVAAYNTRNRKLMIAATRDGILWYNIHSEDDWYFGQYLCISHGMFKNYDENLKKFVLEDTFYILGGSNFGLKSTDGQIWKRFKISNDDNIECIATCNGGKEDNTTFVVLSPPTDTFLVSLNGINWSTVKAPYIDKGHKWIDIAYNNGKFIAITSDASLSYSTDGITWTKPEIIKVFGDETIWPLFIHIVQDPIKVTSIHKVSKYFIIIAERSLYNFSYLISSDGVYWIEYELGDYIDNATVCCSELCNEEGFQLLNSFKWVRCLFNSDFLNDIENKNYLI